MPALGYFVGLDLGQMSDHSALAILEVHEYLDEHHEPYFANDVRHLHSYPLLTSYPEIVRDIASLLTCEPLAQRSTLIVDATGVGRPVVDLLSEVRLYPVSITITGGTEVLTPNWKAALQRRRLRIAADLPVAKILQDELANFEVKVTLAAHDTYGTWREGKHDDLVLALACALWVGAQGRRPGDSAVQAW
jgi:hypothetical protein